jgi:hypothetical protein
MGQRVERAGYVDINSEWLTAITAFDEVVARGGIYFDWNKDGLAHDSPLPVPSQRP